MSDEDRQFKVALQLARNAIDDAEDAFTIRKFKHSMKAVHDAIQAAMVAAKSLPTTKQREYYKGRCLTYLSTAERELQEIDGENGYFGFVEDPSKIDPNFELRQSINSLH